MKKPRVLVLFDTDSDPPATQDYSRHLGGSVDEVEFEVSRVLLQRGYEVRLLGFRGDVDRLLVGLRAEPFDVVFNLTERFRDQSALDYTVAGLLEMLGVPYTGAGPTGLILARHKALTKMVLNHHDVRTPRFIEIEEGMPCNRPSDLRFPLIVKPVDEDASVGIARASVVRDDGALRERVEFVHEKLKTSAIVEEFIAGREIYVGVIGNDQPKALPPIEMVFDAGVPDEARIATFKVKWSTKHRDRMGIKNRIASDLPPEVATRLAEVAVQSYRSAACATTAASTCGWPTTRRSTWSRPTPIPTCPTVKIWPGRRKRAATPTATCSRPSWTWPSSAAFPSRRANEQIETRIRSDAARAPQEMAPPHRKLR
jgi:D-alanine-D-alanine ligase